MHPRTQEVLTYLDSRRADLWSAVDAIPADAHARRPPDGGWSIAGIVEHLGRAESAMTAMLQRHIQDARASGLGTETDSDPIVPTIDVDGLLDRRQPIVAREALHPAGLDIRQGREALERARATLREMVVACDGLALSTVRAPHGRLGELNVYQWLVFIGTHEARHTHQILEVARSIAPDGQRPAR